MKVEVKDTPALDMIFVSLSDKLRNFLYRRYRYTDDCSAIRYVRENFPYYNWNGGTQSEFCQILIRCEQLFGDDWMWDRNKIYFKFEKDRTVFLLSQQ